MEVDNFIVVLLLRFGNFTEKVSANAAMQDKLSNIMQVEKNMLTGTLPNALGTMGNIHWFRFSANMFEGRIPDSFRSTSPLLAVLEIGDNDFDGELVIVHWNVLKILQCNDLDTVISIHVLKCS